MSPLRSSAGPAVATNGTSSSAATICASEVLPRPGRAGQQQVVERLAARAARPRSRRPAGRAAAPGRRTPRAGAGAASGRARPRPPGRASGCARRSAHGGAPSAPAAAPADQLLGALAVGVGEQLVRFLGAVAELDQPGARERPRGAWRRGERPSARGSRATGSGADLLAQLDDDPLGGALADAGHRLQPLGVAGREHRDELARARVDSTASATFGPTAWTVSSIRNSSRSCSLAKPYSVSVSSRAIRCVCSVTFSPGGGIRAASAPRRGGAVADAAAEHHDVVVAPQGDLSAQQLDHRAPARQRERERRAVGVADGHRERVGGVVGARAPAEREQRADHARDLLLGRAPLPQTAPLTCWGV